MKSIDESVLARLRDQVRPYYTEKRYSHALAVEREAAALANLLLPEEMNRLRAAALLHDVTKKYSLEKQLICLDEFGIIVEDIDLAEPKVLHARTGALVAARDFPDVADAEICRAIARHTTGTADMTCFDAILYLADYIEETRTFDDCVHLRRFFYDGCVRNREEIREHFRHTMIRSFDLTIQNLITEHAPIHPDTVCARNTFLQADMEKTSKVK